MAGAISKNFLCFLLCVSISYTDSTPVKTNYVVGTGLYDVTGPAAEINMVRILYKELERKIIVFNFFICFDFFD